MFGKSKIVQALAAALLAGGIGNWTNLRAEEPKGPAKPEAKSGKLVGIVTEKKDTYLMIKPEGEAEAKRYSLVGADGKVPANLQAELKPVFSPNLVAIQWKLLEQPTVTAIAVNVPKARTGSMAGVVVARGDGSPKEFPFLDVKPPGQNYTERYVPPFTKTPDPNLVRAFADTQVGDKVKINWSYDERKRAVGIQVVAKAPAAKAGASESKP